MNPLFLASVTDPYTLLRLAETLGLGDSPEAEDLRNRTSNPHAVTPSMVGLGETGRVIEGEFTVITEEPLHVQTHALGHEGASDGPTQDDVPEPSADE
jgi:hypothetical protein